MNDITRVLSVAELKRQFVASATPLHFGLTVSPTEQCNFRCTYCYEDFELERMSEEVYGALCRLVTRTIPTLRSFGLAWFGGEPLLEWQRMGEFTALCRALAKEHGVAMPPATTPSNAWSLTPERLAYLVEAGVGEFMVSLDGQKEVHDKTRRLISGRGTFERVYRNLLAARDAPIALPFRIIVRLHLHEENLLSQEALAQQLHTDFGADPRFVVHPITLGDFGGPTIHTMRLVSEQDSSATSARIRRLFGGDKALDLGDEGYTVCYAAKPNHILVRPNGRLAKCTSALGRGDNDVGVLKPDGTLEIDPDKALAWSFGFQSGRADHLACPFHEKPSVAPLRFMPRVA